MVSRFYFFFVGKNVTIKIYNIYDEKKMGENV